MAVRRVVRPGWLLTVLLGLLALLSLGWAAQRPGAGRAAEGERSAATPAATYPVTGTVVIEGGASAAGGIAGDSLAVHVAFAASSPYGEVTEMRVSGQSYGCGVEVSLDDVPWEPYVPEKVYTVTLAINWVGFYRRVQYRDAQGNLSPVLCDDISLEGMPPRTPATGAGTRPGDSATPEATAQGATGDGGGRRFCAAALVAPFSLVLAAAALHSASARGRPG